MSVDGSPESGNISRRKLFTSPFKRMTHAPATDSIQVELSQAEQPQQNLSRRELIMLLGKIGTVGYLAHEADKQPTSNTSEHDIEETARKNPDSLSDTALEQLLMIAAKHVAHMAFEKMGIPEGNKSISKDEYIKRIQEKPVETFFDTAVFGPVVEEFAYRLFPSSQINPADTSTRWDVGIPVTTLFALSHNLDLTQFPQLHVQKTIPIRQFMGGMFYWYLMRERGFNHSVFAHSMNNALSFGVAKYLYSTYPPQKADEIATKLPV